VQIAALDPANQSAVLAYLRAAPYRNALLLSNVSQLRARCDVLVAVEDERVLGVASTYHDLPLPNLTFAAQHADIVGMLLHDLADRNPQLWFEPAYALLPLDCREQLGRYASILAAPIEYQMAAELGTFHGSEGRPTHRLTNDDAPDMDALARVCELAVWHRGALALGPAFGCFVDDRLVAMAATHFATIDVIEVGYVATHPDYRRQGYALACLTALTKAAFRLAPRVFLMVMADNQPALAVYKRLGFRAIERFCLARFMLQ
jgi:ribosomal protein S18 acetylase RimI-like enzyme